MTGQPFPLSGKVYDIDETVEEGVTVKIRNTRTDATDSTITNSAGEYVFDLANLTGTYADNDIILIQAWKNGSPFKFITTSALVSGDSIELNLYLRPVLTTQRIIVPSSKTDLKEIQLNQYADEFGAGNVTDVEAERSDFTRNSDGFATVIVEYVRGVKKKTTITRNSSNEVTKIEVS